MHDLHCAPTYDKLASAEERANAYRAIIRDGASLIGADRSIEAANAIQPLLPAKSRRRNSLERKRSENIDHN